jgi:hypothetical protein
VDFFALAASVPGGAELRSVAPPDSSAAPEGGIQRLLVAFAWQERMTLRCRSKIDQQNCRQRFSPEPVKARAWWLSS